jgi:hypothetical protein
MGFLRRLSADGELRQQHEQMSETGERPPYLVEYYSSHRNLYQEAKRLERLGYRVQSRQDMRDANGYRVTFVYVGNAQADQTPPIFATSNNRYR